MSALEQEWPDEVIRDYALMGVLRDVHRARTELTNSELDAVKCMAAGMDYEGAAVLLFKSAETIQSQLKSARLKMACKTTAQLCSEAIRRRLIP